MSKESKSGRAGISSIALFDNFTLWVVAIEIACRIVLIFITPFLWISLEIHNRLGRYFPDASFFRTDLSWSETRKINPRMAGRLALGLLLVRNLPKIPRKSIGLPAIEKTVFLLDHYASVALPHPRSAEGLNLRQDIARRIVIAVFPGVVPFEKLCLEWLQVAQKLDKSNAYSYRKPKTQ